MTVTEIVQSNLIKFDLKADNKDEVIDQLADLYVKNGIITNKDNYISAVYGREQEGTTGVGEGIAIPHGKSKSVTRSAVVIAKLLDPVAWESLDNHPVKYVFLLAIPDGGDTEHLKLLSELAGILMDDNVRFELQQAKSAGDIQAIFKDRGNEL